MKTTSLPTTGGVETRIGELRFEGGYPADETVDKLYEEMDFQRAVQAYFWAIPLVSCPHLWNRGDEEVRRIKGEALHKSLLYKVLPALNAEHYASLEKDRVPFMAPLDFNPYKK